jgi:hypothetical protein
VFLVNSYHTLCYRLTLIIAGAIALLIAFGVVMVLQAKKKRSREEVERFNEQRFSEQSFNEQLFDGPGSVSNSSVRSHISANNIARNSFQDNPFLTESEKAIVTRAVSSDEGQEVSISGGFTLMNRR